jgi:hypothetical protein
MDEDAGRRSKGAWRALAGALLMVFVIALTAVLWRDHRSGAPAVQVPAADPAADTAAAGVAAVRVRVVRLGGNSETFELAASGRVVHESDWDSRELALSPEAVQQLERELVVCGICTLEPADPVPVGPSRRRIDVELLTQPATCSANLPWERWFEDEVARRCLEVIQGALTPLREQCSECTVP